MTYQPTVTATASTNLTTAHPMTYRDYNDSALMMTLAQALSTARPADSISEAKFVGWLASVLPTTMIDGAGNLHVDLRGSGSVISRTLFTGHTDTVHHKDGPNPVVIDGDIWRSAPNSVLGADDGAGVALMAHMIDAEVPGYYIFFRGEECGGIGSKWLVDTMPELLGEFDRAIAFDRAGYNDVITHQAGTRCCSDKFAEALAQALTNDDFTLAFTPDGGGVYTDTAEFVGIIPECTNLSIGYYKQHTDQEQQDVAFLRLLADRLVTIDWDSLPTVRDVNEQESLYDSNPWRSYFQPKQSTKLADMIEDALMFGSTTVLVDYISTVVDPEQPEYVRARMDVGALDEETLEYALSALESGECSAEDMVYDLYSIAQSFVKE